MKKEVTIFTGSFKPPHRGHFEVVKKMLKMTKESNGSVYVFISKKEREPCCRINGPVSKKVWEEYVKLLPKIDQKRVRLVLSKLSSPTQTAYGFIKRIANPKDYFYLVKSAKNADNQRYLSFKNLKIRKRELVLPGYENMYSTHMREAIAEGKRSKFYKYLPKQMKDTQKLKLWNTLKKLC